MGKKNNRFVKVISAMLILVLAVGALAFSLSQMRTVERKTEDTGGANETVLPAVEEQDSLQSDSNEEDGYMEAKGKPDSAAKYFTYSEGGNVDIGVIFMNPITGEKDTLTFKIMINTHTVDLGKYSSLTDFIMLRTDKGLAITDGFEWVKENADSHHVSGVLKIKNDYNGTAILDKDTEYLKLAFVNIAGIKEREHAYQDETLR